MSAGPHALASRSSSKRSALPETERQPYHAHFNMDRHPRIQPALLLDLDHRPVRGGGRRRHAEPAAHLRLQADGPPRRTPARRQILSTLLRRAYRPAVTDADVDAR